MSASRSYRFGEFTLDLRRGALLKAGVEVRLRPKSFEVLRVLAERHGELVSKEELLNAVWGRVIVTEGALTQCLIDIRRALGDEAQRIIRTVPRRGYILDVPVIESATADADVPSSSPPETPPPGNRWAIVRAILLPAIVAAVTAVAIGWLVGNQSEDSHAPPPVTVATASPGSIAVLPFTDMSATRDQAHLGDGIAEEILHRLALSDELRVIARTSSFSFRDQPVDIAEIAARLDVSHVLEGSIRRSGNRIRITAQLIAASSGSHVWSQTYDREVGDLLAVQDEIAAAVARSLHATLAGEARSRQAPASADAYEQFLQGEFFYQRRAPGDIERALQYFERAVALDPGYARAWAALAGTYSFMAAPGGAAAAKWRQQQGAAARKSVELDPQLAMAHKRLAQYYLETFDFDLARAHSRRAYELDPDDPLVIGGLVSEAISRGELQEATRLARQAVAIDPLSPVARTILGALLIAAGELDGAEVEYRKVFDLNPAAGPEVRIDLLRVLVLQQRHAEARELVPQLPEGPYRDYGVALLYQSKEDRAAADAALARLARAPVEIMNSIRLAEACALRGLNDEALVALERQAAAIAQDAASAPGWTTYFQNELRLSPFLASLHPDPRWAALMAIAGKRR